MLELRLRLHHSQSAVFPYCDRLRCSCALCGWYIQSADNWLFMSRDTYDTVSSIDDAFRWVDHTLRVWARHPECTPLQLASALKRKSLSTAFSGVGTPETTTEIIRAHLCSRGIDASAMTCTFAVEMFAQSQRELLAIPHGPECIFSNMTHFIHESIRAGVEAALDDNLMSWDDLRSLLCRAAAIAPSAYCVRHNQMCRARRACFHCAGTPCIDYSGMAGARHGGLAGKASLAFLTWAAQRIQHQEDVIIHENVEDFPVSVFSLVLPMYIANTLVIGPDTLGWPVRRPRRITVLVHQTQAAAPVLLVQIEQTI